ncbi:hypothetical protein XACW160_270028 [Xanthomonas citri pv. citri]|uniref:Uncharacterized protein n=1 Tax=Xanthomonas citri pv. citri TaxID=611301 RepID=A0A0U5FCY4_XANCI|nr:hypothetical protein XAC3824_240029 [Xanthomonas citri pv. citri]CEE21722.1 hypothetical protein XAC1083_220187 [Xanthomonas citri pv. citri]CEE32664.1 hypothetical protein XAC902_300016 [Xanthomonas citri pv. citri]CEE33216.1 hypothetical protein XAC2911_230016 [Xanthomonas citri pv. citri]CEE55354.1 hypothetical protein XAC71A_280029 [Xanthomonas citri pv. citri]
MAARGLVRGWRKLAQCQFPPEPARHGVLSVRTRATGSDQPGAEPAGTGAAPAGLTLSPAFIRSAISLPLSCRARVATRVLAPVALPSEAT